MAKDRKNKDSKPMESNRTGGSFKALKEYLLVLIPLTLAFIGYIVWIIFDYSLFELGRSPMTIFLTFFLAFFLGNVFYRQYYRKKQEEVEQCSSRNHVEVSVLQTFKTQMTIAFIFFSTAALLTFSSVTFNEPIKVLLAVAAASLYCISAVIIISNVVTRVTLSETYVELKSLLKGSRLIPLSSIQEIRIRRSLNARLIGDTPGDTLVIVWNTNLGELKEESINLNRYMENRNLLFSILQSEFK